MQYVNLSSDTQFSQTSSNVSRPKDITNKLYSTIAAAPPPPPPLLLKAVGSVVALKVASIYE